MAQCYACGTEIPELHEGNNPPCPGCGAVAVQFGCFPDFEGARFSAQRAYRDDSFEMRACDHCGKPYRGPAVYCSLDCALADA